MSDPICENCAKPDSGHFCHSFEGNGFSSMRWKPMKTDAADSEQAPKAGAVPLTTLRNEMIAWRDQWARVEHNNESFAQARRRLDLWLRYLDRIDLELARLRGELNGTRPQGHTAFPVPPFSDIRAIADELNRVRKGLSSPYPYTVIEASVETLRAAADALQASEERLSSQAPTQVSDELVERCARALWESEEYTRPWDDVHPEDAGYRRNGVRVVLEAALGTPRGEEGSQTK